MSLLQFWQKLEVRRNRTAIMTEWESLCGDVFEIIRPLLRVCEQKASSFPNPRGGKHMKIVCHKDGTIVAVDEDDVENRTKLKKHDILLYQVHLNSLRKLLCDTLSDVKTSKTSLDSEIMYHHIGNWEPKKAASFPIYLLLCPTRKTFKDQILHLRAYCKKSGAILLTPTREKWSEDIDELARAGRMLLVSLEDIISTENGGFDESKDWLEYLDAFCQLIETSLPQNYRANKARSKRAEIMAKVEKVKKELAAYIRSARSAVNANMDVGKGMVLDNFLTKTDLANLAGVETYHVTRCFAADPQLKILFNIANTPEELLRYPR